MNDAGRERPHNVSLSGRAGSILNRVSGLLLYIIVLAAPWEIFQRTPLAGLTLVKLAGTTLIAVALARAAITRTWPLRRTGLELPIAALVAMGLLCTAHSLDRAASWAQLRVYLSYVILFYATASAVRDAKTSERLIFALTVSSAAVSALALLCAAGFWTPSLSYATRLVGHRVVPGMPHEFPLRMVAASDDFNQGVFIPLMAFALALFALGRPMCAARRIGLYAMLALLVGAMLVAVSRSSVLIVVCLTGVYLLVQLRARTRVWPAVVALVLILAIGGVAGQRYLQAFVTRATSVSSHDPSYEGRRYGYAVAWRALPQYALTGAGLNTSDVILSRAGHPEILRGQTLHSVPFKFLLETGVFGLLSYLALVGAFALRLWRDGVRGSSDPARRLGAGFLAWLFACFLVTSVQPLNAVSLFPVMVGLALGPLSRRDGIAASDSARESNDLSNVRVDAIVAGLIVAAVVLPNALRYQALASRVAHFADRLEDGRRYEKAADWGAAETAYSDAALLAESHAENAHSDWRAPIDAAPYYANAAAVYELEFVFKNLDLGRAGGVPRASAEYALARSLVAQGRLAGAVERLDRALSYDRAYAAAWFMKGECYWALSEFALAIDAYAQAAAQASAPGNGAYADTLKAITQRADELGRQTPAAPEALLEAARLWRLQGKWDKALELYRRTAVEAPNEADAHFHLGAEAQMRGKTNQAITEYETALRLLPNHYESAHALRRLHDRTR